MSKVRVGSHYIYKPVGLDLWDACTNLEAGTEVKVINLHGCPPANTMGHCYVEDMDGNFKGLVLCNSLEKVKK